MQLETQRLTVRPFRADDLGDLFEIFGDAETMRNCEPAYDLEKTREFLETFCIGRNGALAAELTDTRKVIGYILFNALEAGVYEIGWFFNRGYWRQGYAYESCAAVLQFAFGEMHLHKVMAEAIDAEKSVRLMEKLGMQREGVQRSHTRDNDGNWADLYLYGLLESDWREDARC